MVEDDAGTRDVELKRYSTFKDSKTSWGLLLYHDASGRWYLSVPLRSARYFSYLDPLLDVW